jgi:hypothetical protein
VSKTVIVATRRRTPVIWSSFEGGKPTYRRTVDADDRVGAELTERLGVGRVGDDLRRSGDAPSRDQAPDAVFGSHAGHRTVSERVHNNARVNG